MDGASRIQVGDIEICYRWDGAEHGPVVMMAHAMGTSHKLWDPQIERLGARYRILRYDWRGHGDTSAPEGPYSLAQFVEDACGLMDVLDVPWVHWVGISTGGMIGQGLGIHRPDRIRSLALCNTTSKSTPWYRDWVAERQALVKAEGMEPVWARTERLWFTDAFVDAQGPGYTEVREVFVRTPVAGYLGGTSAVVDLDYQEDLHRISVPTLVLGAGADPVTPPEQTHAIASRISGARVAFLEGQHHFSNVEEPDRFTACLADFLGEVVR